MALQRATSPRNVYLWTFLSERPWPLYPETARLGWFLVLLFARLLAAALTRQSFFHPLPFAGLQVERVTFYLFYDVLGLYLPLKPTKSILEGFPLLKPNFSQADYTPLLVLTGHFKLWQGWRAKSSGMCRNFRLAAFRPGLGPLLAQLG